MDWVLYIFTKGYKRYLVPAESLEDAWEVLRKRQSRSMKNLKMSYNYIRCMDANSRIVKL